mmetsp:Transcript_47898/g.147781  ORF Transcript_47898/g.147781 Transcript_47898/m.147781 type:complete len:270 (-) Transcript_47898:315-1124(-)
MTTSTPSVSASASTSSTRMSLSSGRARKARRWQRLAIRSVTIWPRRQPARTPPTVALRSIAHRTPTMRAPDGEARRHGRRRPALARRWKAPIQPGRLCCDRFAAVSANTRPTRGSASTAAVSAAPERTRWWWRASILRRARHGRGWPHRWKTAVQRLRARTLPKSTAARGSPLIPTLPATISKPPCRARPPRTCAFALAMTPTAQARFFRCQHCKLRRAAERSATRDRTLRPRRWVLEAPSRPSPASATFSPGAAEPTLRSTRRTGRRR